MSLHVWHNSHHTFDWSWAFNWHKAHKCHVQETKSILSSLIFYIIYILICSQQNKLLSLKLLHIKCSFHPRHTLNRSHINLQLRQSQAVLARQSKHRQTPYPVIELGISIIYQYLHNYTHYTHASLICDFNHYPVVVSHYNRQIN